MEDAAEDSVAVDGGKFSRAQVGVDDHFFAVDHAAVDDVKELGVGEGIGELGAQIVDDQEIRGKEAVVGHFYFVARVAIKGFFLEDAHQAEGGFVDHGFSRRHELGGDGVGKEGLAQARGAVEEQIHVVGLAEGGDEVFRHGQDLFHVLPRGNALVGEGQIGVDVQAEVAEIVFFDLPLDVAGAVEVGGDPLFHAAAALAVFQIALVLAAAAAVDGIQVIRRKPRFHEHGSGHGFVGFELLHGGIGQVGVAA